MKTLPILLAVVLFYACEKSIPAPDPSTPLLKSYVFFTYDTTSGDVILGDTVRFQYDNAGKIIRILSNVENSDNQINISYDNQNRVIELKNDINRDFTPLPSRKYTYNGDGTLQSITCVDNTKIHFTYTSSPGGYAATVELTDYIGTPAFFSLVLLGNHTIVLDTLNKIIKAVDVNDADKSITYQSDDYGLTNMIDTYYQNTDTIFRLEYPDRSLTIVHPLYKVYHSIFGDILWTYISEDYSRLFYFTPDYLGNINTTSIHNLYDKNYFPAFEDFISYTTVMDGSLVKSIQKRNMTGKLLEETRFYY